jgi:hypothetical protein
METPGTRRRQRCSSPTLLKYCLALSALLIATGYHAQVSAAAFGPKNSSPRNQSTVRKALSPVQLAVRALAATCVRFPNGEGLPEAVAPGSALSLPPLPPHAARQLSASTGAIGWRLPPSIGAAALVLRPDGICSVLIQNINPKGIGSAVRDVFSMIQPLHLKTLESNTCDIHGLPLTTTMYAMIPANDIKGWSTPEVHDGKTTWRGFLLSVAVRRDGANHHQMAMTTYVGRHEIGMTCDGID